MSDDKYPDMSAMYAVQFEYENKLKDKIKELETELERTRKALDIAVDALKRLNNDSIFGMRVLGIADQALTAINEITKGRKDEKLA